MAERPKIILSDDDFDGDASGPGAASATAGAAARHPAAPADTRPGTDADPGPDPVGVRHEWLRDGAARPAEAGTAAPPPLPPVTRHAAVPLGDVGSAKATDKAATP